MAKSTKLVRGTEAGGIAFVGCILTGAGLGWVFGTEWLVPGTIIGLGIGFLIMAVMTHRSAK